MTDLQADIDRASHAARLLRDPLLLEAFASIEQAIHEQWASSPLRDIEGQIALRHMLNQIRDLRTFFEVVLADGKAAGEELKRMREQRDVLTPKQFFGATR